MPNWNSVLQEIALENTQSAFDRVRRRYLRTLFRHTGRHVIAYYSGFLSKPRIDGIGINDEDKNGFMLCIHEMDRAKGLDLILHTPGGDGQATESLVEYLRSMFGKNMRAIVPQIAMSAGTMIACSCSEILMGKQSSLGPIDPQFGVIAAANLLEEVRRARDEIVADPRLAMFWNPILSKITPSFLERCEWAVRMQNEFITKTLAENMFSDLDGAARAAAVDRAAKLLVNEEGKAHSMHLGAAACEEAGLKIVRLEDDQKLQDLVLTLHHCYIHTLSNTACFKIIENDRGRAIVKLAQMQILAEAAPQALAPVN